MTASTSIMLVAFSLGAIVLWISAKWFRFWKSVADQILIGAIVLLMVATIASLAFWHDSNESIRDSFFAIAGSPITLVVSLIVAMGSWLFCIYDAPRCIARESTLLE